MPPVKLMAANIQKELAEIDLGDERRDRRILRLASRMAESPSQSLRAACGGWGDAVGAFRLLHSPLVTPDKILEAHCQATLKRAEACDSLLFIDDTTELDYSSHKALTEVGRLDHDFRRGFYAHNHLLADEDSGVALGLYGSKIWTRDPEAKSRSHQKTPFEAKESCRWHQGYVQACALAADMPARQVLYVGDRESDIYEIFVERAGRLDAGEAAADLVLRTGRDRALIEKGEHLFEQVRNAPELGCFELKISANTRRKKVTLPGKGKTSRMVERTARTTKLTIRAATVTFRAPHRNFGGKLPAVEMNVVLVREVDPPEGQEPIEWILLTTLPIEGLEQAWRVVQAYAKRWLIEEFHRILKSGCRVEDIQLRKGHALLCAVALYMIVAWRILYLRDLSRGVPELPCTLFFSEAEWRAACIIQRKPVGTSPPSLKDVVELLGKIGGHMGRKNDPPPGPECLWKGLEKLRQYVEMGQALGAL